MRGFLDTGIRRYEGGGGGPYVPAGEGGAIRESRLGTPIPASGFRLSPEWMLGSVSGGGRHAFGEAPLPTPLDSCLRRNDAEVRATTRVGPTVSPWCGVCYVQGFSGYRHAPV